MVFFLGVVHYIVGVRRKREILVNFWLTEKNTKAYEIVFSDLRRKERKANIYFVFGKTTGQNNDEQELGSRRGQLGAGRLHGKNQTLRNEKF